MDEQAIQQYREGLLLQYPDGPRREGVRHLPTDELEARLKPRRQLGRFTPAHDKQIALGFTLHGMSRNKFKDMVSDPRLHLLQGLSANQVKNRITTIERKLKREADIRARQDIAREHAAAAALAMADHAPADVNAAVGDAEAGADAQAAAVANAAVGVAGAAGDAQVAAVANSTVGVAGAARDAQAAAYAKAAVAVAGASGDAQAAAVAGAAVGVAGASGDAQAAAYANAAVGVAGASGDAQAAADANAAVGGAGIGDEQAGRNLQLDVVLPKTWSGWEAELRSILEVAGGRMHWKRLGEEGVKRYRQLNPSAMTRRRAMLYEALAAIPQAWLSEESTFVSL